jgi:hypothetical protein
MWLYLEPLQARNVAYCTHSGPSPIRTNYHIPVDEACVLTLRRRLVELASAAVDSAQPRKIEWDKAPARLVGALITSYLTMRGVTLVMAR